MVFVEKEAAMGRARWIFGALLAVLVGVMIGIGSYNAGVSHGLAQAGHATQVVRVVGAGYGFPFGFLFFPLFIFLFIFLIRGAMWGRRWRGGHPHGEWRSGEDWGGRGRAFEDWHRQQHDTGDGGTGDPGASRPATV
jgi:hypothetical protein